MGKFGSPPGGSIPAGVPPVIQVRICEVIYRDAAGHPLPQHLQPAEHRLVLVPGNPPQVVGWFATLALALAGALAMGYTP